MELLKTNEKTQDKTSLKKSNTYLLVDVETCNDQRIIMELSFLVINKLMGKKKEKCYIIKEVWENEEYRNGKYDLELIPMGAARLRISSFPQAK